MLHYFTIPVTPFQQNCSVVHDDERREMIEQLQQAIRLIDRHLEGM